MTSKLHEITDEEFDTITAGMPEGDLDPDEREAVRMANAMVAAGESFATTAELRTTTPTK